MSKVIELESGYDFITLYFETLKETNDAAESLYRFCSIRVSPKTIDMNLQRKNFVHKPGDVPHFHNGIEATKGAHFHIIYSDRPSEKEWEELRELLTYRLVDISLPENIQNQEIS